VLAGIGIVIQYIVNAGDGDRVISILETKGAISIVFDLRYPANASNQRVALYNTTVRLIPFNGYASPLCVGKPPDAQAPSTIYD